MCHMNLGYVLLSQGIVVQLLPNTRYFSFSFCATTNKCTITSQLYHSPTFLLDCRVDKSAI